MAMHTLQGAHPPHTHTHVVTHTGTVRALRATPRSHPLDTQLEVLAATMTSCLSASGRRLCFCFGCCRQVASVHAEASTLVPFTWPAAAQGGAKGSCCCCCGQACYIPAPRCSGSCRAAPQPRQQPELDPLSASVVCGRDAFAPLTHSHTHTHDSVYVVLYLFLINFNAEIEELHKGQAENAAAALWGFLPQNYNFYATYLKIRLQIIHNWVHAKQKPPPRQRKPTPATTI